MSLDSSEGSLKARICSEGFGEISQLGFEIWDEFQRKMERGSEWANTGLDRQGRLTQLKAFTDNQ